MLFRIQHLLRSLLPRQTRLMHSLRYKAWLLIMVCSVALTSLAAWFSSKSISASFTAQELTDAEQAGERALRLLKQQLESLSASATDYAYWHDTVAFLEGRSSTYLNDNFTPESLKSLRLSGVLLYTTDGTLRAATAVGNQADLVEPETGVKLAAEALLPVVLADERSQTVVDTYRAIDGTLYLMTAAPVRDFAAVGTAPRGALVMFSRFDQVQRERFGDVLMTTVNLSFGPHVSNGADFELRVLGNDRAEASILVRDHENHPVARLLIGLDRLLHQQGRALVWSAASQVALAGLVLGALLMWLLDRLMLQRLANMQRQLVEIAERGAFSVPPMDDSGGDELSDVARGLNRVLELSRQISDQRDRMSELASQLIAAQEKERRLVARELHDQVGQILTALYMQLSKLNAQGTTGPSLDAPIELAEEALRHARDLTAMLHPHILDDLGLCAALNWQINRYVRPSLSEVKFQCVLAPERGDPTIELVVFRVVQESLTNVIRHAKADRVEIEVRVDGEWLQLQVADDGAGFRVGDSWIERQRLKSIGVASMRERVEMLGGQFDLDSAPGAGTQLRVILPWPFLLNDLKDIDASAAG